LLLIKYLSVVIRTFIDILEK